MFLERARKGQLQWLGIAYVGPDMISRSCIYERPDASPQLLSASIGAAAYLHARYSASIVRGAVEVVDTPETVFSEEVYKSEDEGTKD